MAGLRTIPRVAMIVQSVEIARSPEDVFAYLDDLEITGHEPPRMVAFRGINGPVRPVGTVTVEPFGPGSSKVTIELELQGHGLLGAIL